MRGCFKCWPHRYEVLDYQFEDDETICGGVIQQELDVIFKSFGWPILYQIGDIKPQHGAHGLEASS